MKKKGLLAGFAVGLMVGLFLIPVVARTAPEENDSVAKRFGLPPAWDEAFFQPLGNAAAQIQARYVDDVDPARALVGAYEGILNALDEYGSYIPLDRLEEFEGDTKGEFGGLGIQIRFLPLEKILRVEQPIPGTPAFRLGILTGDIITKVKEEATGEMVETRDFKDVHDAVRILRGEPGTKVTLTVVHEGTGKEEDITVEREVIKIPGIYAPQMLDEKWKIGYVYVPAFHERTVEDLKNAIGQLQGQGLKALIVDLRFNPGGLLTSAIDMSDLFLGDAVVVSTRGRAMPDFVFRTRADDVLQGAPLAILVNRHSASASEIVAGAIKDNGRGLVIGEITYGKGSVQTIIPLRDKQGALKLTTARYYTPSGVCIQKTGVAPDVEIKLTDQELRGLARKLASLAEYPPQPKPEPPKETAPPAPQGAGEEQPKPQEAPFRDVQLERALDILTGILIQQQRQQAAETAQAVVR